MLQQGKDLNNMSIIELKGLAYDLIALLEQTQNNIRIVNAKIQEKSQEVPEVKNEK